MRALFYRDNEEPDACDTGTWVNGMKSKRGRGVPPVASKTSPVTENNLAGGEVICMQINQLHPSFFGELVGLDTSAPISPETMDR